MAQDQPGKYRDEDFPYTFYFQGEELPKWSNIWPGTLLTDIYFDYYLEEVWRKIDHEGMIESEDSDLFIVAAQETLIGVIKKQDEFVESMKDRPGGDTFEFQKWLLGITRTIEIAENHKVVFWTSGYEDDLQALKDRIAKFELGPNHPDFLAAPHQIDRYRHTNHYINTQRRALRSAIQSYDLSKQLRQFIYNLPKRA